MLFNSFPFLLVFLPGSLVLHALVERFRPGWRLPLLVALSFAFYSYWDWRFVPLLGLSILANWGLAEAFIRSRGASGQGAKADGAGWLIAAAILLNLAVLGMFKYAAFFAGLIGWEPTSPGAGIFGFDVALPLGISFFTFHHVMYLTDLKAGRAPRFDLMRYALYIAFFPQVLAGPLVRWSEIMHQFDERPYARSDAAERFARGLLLLTLGLAKKVFVGDPLADYANPVFQAAAAGDPVSVLAAWQGTLAFTFQIYFDFSGYTDMALGIALLFGITLPQNFETPYRAVSLQDFWRRWHMTLSRFLRDYLYIPLGGNRHGLAVQLLALFATMALGGLWHGAGLTFVAWGVMHGLGLCVGILWRKAGWPMPRLVGWMLTFVFVMLAWVLFRATSFEAALRIYEAMLGFGPKGFEFKWRTLALAGALAIVGPTAWALAHKVPPSRWIASAAALLVVLVLLKIGNDANYEFIYFQF
jgi:D-alanyl-lipoteichoic acid acyltransferase DltB (MBOAT superfamily)